MDRCSKCGKKATWWYGPGDGNACDDCVPRGCSCNLELKPGVKEIDFGAGNTMDDYYQPTDELGREWPCCEWMRYDDELLEVIRDEE